MTVNKLLFKCCATSPQLHQTTLLHVFSCCSLLSRLTLTPEQPGLFLVPHQPSGFSIGILNPPTCIPTRTLNSPETAHDSFANRTSSRLWAQLNSIFPSSRVATMPMASEQRSQRCSCKNINCPHLWSLLDVW